MGANSEGFGEIAKDAKISLSQLPTKFSSASRYYIKLCILIAFKLQEPNRVIWLTLCILMNSSFWFDKMHLG